VGAGMWVGEVGYQVGRGRLCYRKTSFVVF